MTTPDNDRDGLGVVGTIIGAAYLIVAGIALFVVVVRALPLALKGRVEYHRDHAAIPKPDEASPR